MAANQISNDSKMTAAIRNGQKFYATGAISAIKV